MPQLPRLPREKYTVGWVCALPVELAAAQEMLDEEHEDPEGCDDENLYSLGSIAGHNIVIVCLPAGHIGNNPAAAAATHMRATFKGIRFGLMVGIGGGVPSAETDIRLGDVVVSQPHQTFGGVVQYDAGKTTPSGFKRTGSLNAPPQILLAAVGRARAKELRGRSNLSEYISKISRIPRFQRKKAGPDVLFEAAYDHEGGYTCDKCSTDRQVARPPRDSEDEVVIHYGTIASGNQVIRDGRTRDRLSQELDGILCFEMEAAGLMNSFPCLVIRGICDYADSHKNKAWELYAAGTAAAYAKEVLSIIKPADVARTRTVDEAIWNINQKLDVVNKKADTLLLNITAKLPTAKGASFDSHMEEHNSICLPGTRTKLLDHIQEWANDSNGKPIFWLNGAAGTGKSTIARTIARTFADQRQLGASFFFKRGEGERGNATRFFTTVATQLRFRVAELGLGVKNAIKTDPAISEKALKDQFEKLILQPLLDVSHLPALVLLIVIDALDECERDSDVRVILQLLSRIRDLKSVSLRVFVTSRPEFHIRLGFKKLPNGTYENLLLHQVTEQTIEHDIRVYFEHELGQIQQQRSLPLNWPSGDQVYALVEQAVPLFIFAATACRYIGDPRDNPRKRLETILGYRKAKVSNLDATYLPILNQLLDGKNEEDREVWACEFREIVGSIIVLETPLSAASLARLLSRSKDDINCQLSSLHSVLSIPDRDDVPVRLLHLSFRDFLVDTSKKEKIPFWVDERERHQRLASHCLELMSGPDGLRQNICGLEPGALRGEFDEGKITSHLSPELQYACRYWVSHLKQSQQDIVDGDITHLFLQKHLVHWLEAMSLVGELNRLIHLLNNIQALIALSGKTVLSLILDAKRFVLRFQSILADAPLQVYYSALVFAPEKSFVRQIIECQQEVHLVSKRETDWDACRSTLEGHADWVNAVAFSPDGELVASASDDRTVRLWKAATGTCHSTLEGHSSWIRAVAFSPDGQLVASASEDNTVRLWEAATGRCHSTLEGHSNSVRAVAFSPDGQLVASASDDRTVRLWEVATGMCHSTLEGHSDLARAVAFSPHSQLVASASRDKTVRLWEVATGRCHSTLKGHSNWVSAVAFSPDGQLVASASDDRTVRLWKAATGTCHSTLEGHSSWIRAVAFSPDGQLVASASDDRTVRLWEAATGRRRSTLEGHSDLVRAVAFSPDGQLVASASNDKTVRLWEVATGRHHNTLEGHSDYISTVAFSPDGQLVASTSRDKTVRLWEATTGRHHSTFEGHSNSVRAVAFSPDGQLVASASEDNTVRLWEAATGRCHSTLEGHSNSVRAVAFSPDGQLVASTTKENTVWLWEAATWTCYSTLEGHSDWVNTVAFSPDGQLIASASDDNTVRLWEAATGRHYSTLEGHSNSVREVAFSPDGQLVASASEDNTVRLWEAATGTCRSTLEGHSNSIAAVAFSPDGQLVASASNDNTVRLWEAATGACRSTFKGYSSSVTAMTFSPDGQYLQTDQGDISLYSSPAPSSPLFQWTQPSRIFVQDQWICRNQQRLLWLPNEYRPTCSAVNKEVVCFGHASGRITLLRLCTA